MVDYTEYVKDCLLAFEYYVERGLSLRKCSKELLMSHASVKRRLESLKDIDIDKYYEYLSATRRRYKRK